MDPATGLVWLDRLLFTATVYPADYGYADRTIADDGDPLDLLVLLDEPTFPGCRIRARPIGVFRMSDEKGQDDKILCLPAKDPRSAAVTDIGDVPEYVLNEIGHFFEVYKELEPGKGTTITGWAGREDAEAIYAEASGRYTDGPESTR